MRATSFISDRDRQAIDRVKSLVARGITPSQALVDIGVQWTQPAEPDWDDVRIAIKNLRGESCSL